MLAHVGSLLQHKTEGPLVSVTQQGEIRLQKPSEGCLRSGPARTTSTGTGVGSRGRPTPVWLSPLSIPTCCCLASGDNTARTCLIWRVVLMTRSMPCPQPRHTQVHEGATPPDSRSLGAHWCLRRADLPPRQLPWDTLSLKHQGLFPLSSRQHRLPSLSSGLRPRVASSVDVSALATRPLGAP